MSEKLLTIAVSNRNRMAPDNKATKLWVSSIENQVNKNFDVIAVDGGSKNYTELKDFLSKHNIFCIQHIIGEKFHRGLLNNVGVRNAKTPYIACSDADMFFAPKLFDTVISMLDPNKFIESRTMYWKDDFINKIYKGILDPVKNIDSCKQGRIKKRTTAGGFQCGHIDIWNKIRGYDERMDGWGSDDVDLVARVGMAGFKIKWLGESLESIMLFHQPHDKPNYIQDMKDQYKNLDFYYNIKSYAANPDGWGGIK